MFPPTKKEILIIFFWALAGLAGHLFFCLLLGFLKGGDLGSEGFVMAGCVIFVLKSTTQSNLGIPL